MLPLRERNHRATREEDKISHVEIHRAGGSNVFYFFSPSQSLPSTQETSTAPPYISVPSPILLQPRHDISSTNAYSYIGWCCSYCDNTTPCLVNFKEKKKSVVGLNYPLLQEIYKCNPGFSCQNEFSSGNQTHCKRASADLVEVELHLLALGLNMTLNVYFFSLRAAIECDGTTSRKHTQPTGSIS